MQDVDFFHKPVRKNIPFELRGIVTTARLERVTPNGSFQSCDIVVSQDMFGWHIVEFVWEVDGAIYRRASKSYSAKSDAVEALEAHVGEMTREDYIAIRGIKEEDRNQRTLILSKYISKHWDAIFGEKIDSSFLPLILSNRDLDNYNNKIYTLTKVINYYLSMNENIDIGNAYCFIGRSESGRQRLRSFLNLMIELFQICESDLRSAVGASSQLEFIRTILSFMESEVRGFVPNNKINYLDIEIASYFCEDKALCKLCGSLRRSGIIYIGDLVSRTESELLEHVSPSTLLKIKWGLASLGLRTNSCVRNWNRKIDYSILSI